MTDSKKTGIKVLLLVLGVALGIGGILVFYKTKVSPPTNLKYSNQHFIYLKGQINSLSDSKVQNDTALYNIMNELNWYHRDDFISLQESGILTDSLAKAYVPLFISTSKAEFNKDVWDNVKLNDFLSHISMLRGWTTNNGDPVISGSLAQGLNDIEITISQYRKAWTIAHSTRFHGMAAAKSVIESAHYYSKLSNLQPCTSLMEALSNVAPKLEKQHFWIIKSKVQSLNRGWFYTSQDNYNTRINSVSNAVKEYSNSARSTYGDYASSTSSLSASIKEYKNQADAYYLEKAKEEYERQQSELQNTSVW